jgi:Ca-activated chloride channel family protein
MKFLIFIVSLVVFNSGLSQDWREELTLARKFYKQKKYKEAYDKYLKVSEIKPKNIDISTEIAQSLYKLGEYNSAAKKYTLTTKNKALNKYDIQYNIGNSYFNSGDFSKAIEAYKKVLRSNPNHNQARHNLALALKKNKPNQPKNQPNSNKDKKNPPKPKPNPPKNDKKQEDKQDPPQQSMQNDRTERMLDELMKQEMKAKQKKNKGNNSTNSSNNGKDW